MTPPQTDTPRSASVIDTSFVPGDIDCSDWSQIEPLARDLLERPLTTVSDLEQWLVDRGELESALREAEANRYIAMTCDTADEAKKKAYMHIVEEIQPKFKPLAFAMDQRLVGCDLSRQLESPRYDVLLRDARRDVEIFREENVPIETELASLDQQYQEICGAMTCDFDGQKRTMPQMMRYLEETDRSKREMAWRSMWERRMRDADRIDAIYDQMIAKRNQIALNAGYENFRDYQHAHSHRFDYTPSDCDQFHASIEAKVVPLVRELDAQRSEALDVAPLRPWDLAVDVKGRAPLRPFEDAQELIDSTRRAFTNMDASLGAMFARLEEPGCLDLESREGKAPGGYQYNRDRVRKPFIFMNAAGLERDVITLLHEGGHAFHSMLCSGDPILHYRHSPIEFAEVASMSMELLAHPYFGDFYSQENVARARRRHLEGILNVLPWIATIDAFQHWIYTHPAHTHDERRDQWVALEKRFGHDISWEGDEEYRDRSWQRQLHLFGYPFYYIEYGIAQIGALQMWVRSLENEADAIAGYQAGLTLGGSRPLPALFEAAGLEFDFSAGTIGRLVDRIGEELAGLEP